MTVLMLCFQNLSRLNFEFMLKPRSKWHSQNQARELLGISYRGSAAQKFEDKTYLNYLIYKKLDESSSKSWKDKIPVFVQTLVDESQVRGLDPIFILAVIQTESQFDPKARGSAGEIGLMQILPTTAKWISEKNKMMWNGEKSLYDPIVNVRLGIFYVDYLRDEFEGKPYHYLPAYNMGAGNLRRLTKTQGSQGKDGKILKREYAVKVMKNYFAIYQKMSLQQKQLRAIAAVESHPVKAR